MRRRALSATGISASALLAIFAAAVLYAVSGCTTQTTRTASQSTGAQSVDIQNRPGVETDLGKRANIRMQLAINYFQDGNFNVALDELKEALRLDPNFAEAHGVLALVYMQLGEKGLAEQSFQRALQLKPNDSDLNNNYGWYLCQNGREPQAMGYFENALKNPLYAQPARPLQNAGLCKLKTGDRKGAEAYLRRSFELDPSAYASAFNLANIYLAQNEIERAQFYVGQVNKSANATAASVWLALRIEHRLGHRVEEDSLGARLKRDFPAARETQLLLRGAYDE